MFAITDIPPYYLEFTQNMYKCVCAIRGDVWITHFTRFEQMRTHARASRYAEIPIIHIKSENIFIVR